VKARHLNAMVGAALLAGVLLRLWHLDADPPPFLSLDFGDEGTWAFSARNKLIEGCWNCGPYNLAFFTAPLYSLLSYVAMRAGGLTLWTIRFPAALAGIFSVILFWQFLRRVWDAQSAAVATAWFSLCQFHVAHSRVGLVESTLLAAEMLVWGCLYIPGRIAVTVAGLLFGASFLLKHVAAQDVPALLLIFVAGWAAGRRRATDAVWFIGGPLTILLGYFLIRGISIVEWARTIKAMTAWGATVHGVPAFFANTALLWMFFPAIGSLVYLFSLRFPEGLSGWRAFCRERQLEAYAAAIVIGNAAGIMVNTYQPERRFLMLTPAAIVLATAAWKELRGSAARRPILGVVSAFCVGFLVLRVTVSGFGEYLEIFRRSLFNPPDHLFPMQLLAAAAMALVFRKIRLTPMLASTALSAALAVELALCATWLPRPTYEVKSSFAEIASLPYNGPLLTNTDSLSVALGFAGCLRVFGPGIHDGRVDNRFLYHLRVERAKRRSFDSADPVEYRAVLPPFPFIPWGSRLVKSFVAAPGVGGRPPRERHWLWINPFVARGPGKCCALSWPPVSPRAR